MSETAAKQHRGERKVMAVAQIREGIRPGSGFWFYDCPACPCDFGPLTRDRAAAEAMAAGHDAEFHAGAEMKGERS